MCRKHSNWARLGNVEEDGVSNVRIGMARRVFCTLKPVTKLTHCRLSQVLVEAVNATSSEDFKATFVKKPNKVYTSYGYYYLYGLMKSPLVNNISDIEMK